MAKGYGGEVSIETTDVEGNKRFVKVADISKWSVRLHTDAEIRRLIRRGCRQLSGDIWDYDEEVAGKAKRKVGVGILSQPANRDCRNEIEVECVTTTRDPQ